jgi:hypothetical protein
MIAKQYCSLNDKQMYNAKLILNPDKYVYFE